MIRPSSSRTPARRSATTLSSVVLALALALTGCTQPEEANDNGPEPDPTQPGGIVRTPQSDSDVESTVPLPGESNSPDVSAEISAEATPSSR